MSQETLSDDDPGRQGALERLVEAGRRHDEILRACREEREHRELVEVGRALGDNLPEPEAEITNRAWFDFLLGHPELTGWAASPGLQP
ncbi:MAG: hypothetical protein ACJ752_00570 [Gaiellaceae bacterium]